MNYIWCMGMLVIGRLIKQSIVIGTTLFAPIKQFIIIGTPLFASISYFLVICELSYLIAKVKRHVDRCECLSNFIVLSTTWYHEFVSCIYIRSLESIKSFLILVLELILRKQSCSLVHQLEFIVLSVSFLKEEQMSEKAGFETSNVDQKERVKKQQELVNKHVLSKQIRVLFIPNQENKNAQI
ncbi:hypothetical protein COOONC_12273 [Cooperia oncophora]